MTKRSGRNEEVGSITITAFRFVVSRPKVFKDSIFLIALAVEYMGFCQFQITPRCGYKYFSMFQFGNNNKRWHKTPKESHLRSDQVQSHGKQQNVSIANKEN